MNWRIQFSLRTVLSLVTVFATCLATCLQVPHIFIFCLASFAAAITSYAAYRTRGSWQRLCLIFASILAWSAFYVLSLGPFITLSEWDRRLTGHYHLGRLANAYRPAMRLNIEQPFRWYMSQWVPRDAVGLHALYPPRVSPDLVGTWQGVTNLVSLRADGTGWARFTTDKRRMYFEWTADEDEFAIFQYGSKRSAFAWFGRVMMNYAPTDTLDLIESSAAQFKLRARNDGRIYTLTRIEDEELESIP